MLHRLRASLGPSPASFTDPAPPPARPPESPVRWRPSLRSALLLFSMFALLPLFGMLVVAAGIARKNTEDLWHAQSEEMIERVADRIRRELDPIRENAAYLARLVAAGKIETDDRTALTRHLAAALSGLPQISDLAVIDTDINVIRVNRNLQRTTQTSWAKDPSVVAMVRAGTTLTGPEWSGFFFAEAARSTRLELRTPLRREGRYIGLLISVITISGLSEFVAEIGRDVAGEAFVLAGHNAVAAHSRLTHPVAGISDAKPLPGIDQVDDPILAGIWQPQQHGNQWTKLPESDRSHVATIDGVDHYFLYRSLQGYGSEPWLVGVHRPLSTIDQPFRRLRLLEGAGFAIALATASGFWIVAWFLSRPLRALSRQALRLREFDWNSPTRLPRSIFREMDQAFHSFNAMTDALSKAATYLPNSLIDRLLRNDEPDQAASETRDITVMFTDIVGFSAAVADMPPADVVELLNRHFAAMVACVERNGGTVDKFVGDGLMAFWGAPEHQPDHAERALSTAVDMQMALRSENDARARQGLPPIRMRIGLHSGAALVGSIGAPGRVNFTAVGDTVNIAQRMEDFARRFMGEQDSAVILFTQETLRRLSPGLESFSLGKYLVPGHGRELEIFRLA